MSSVIHIIVLGLAWIGLSTVVVVGIAVVSIWQNDRAESWAWEPDE